MAQLKKHCFTQYVYANDNEIDDVYANDNEIEPFYVK